LALPAGRADALGADERLDPGLRVDLAVRRDLATVDDRAAPPPEPVRAALERAGRQLLVLELERHPAIAVRGRQLDDLALELRERLRDLGECTAPRGELRGRELQRVRERDLRGLAQHDARARGVDVLAAVGDSERVVPRGAPPRRR